VKASVRDSQALEALRPLEIVSYLRSTGWVQQSIHPERYSVWTHANGNGSYEVVVPLTRFRDFALRMSEVLTTLESAEQRSQLQILSDLSFSNADVVRISSDLRDTHDGTIPLEEAVTLVQKTKEAVLAAACSAIEPRAYFAPRKFGQALDYIKRVKMGQTERGSYTVTVVSKVSPVLQQPELPIEELEEPYERRVIRTLGIAISYMKIAAENAAATGSLDSFKQGVGSGISANLCDALVGMTGDRESVRGLEFSFSWSRTRPPRQDVLHPIFISPDALPVIEEAGRLLREISPKEEFELLGMVIKLARYPDSNVGNITVLGVVEERVHLVKIELHGAEYDLAVKAHDSRTPIFVMGDLVREGRSFLLRQPRSLRLVQPDQDGLLS